MILGVALLGYGSVARKHIYALRNVGFHFPDYGVKASVAVVYGRHEDRVKSFAETYDIPYAVTSIDDAVRPRYVDVVDIALPNHLHYPSAIKALEYGKHVISEKPLATSASDAWDMYFKAKDSKIVHGVMYNYRWLPAVRLAKELISSGAIGKVYHFTGTYLEDYGADPAKPATWRFRRETAGSGTLGDNATHVIDLARFLVGEISEVCSLGETYIRRRPRADGEGFTDVDTDDEFISLVRFDNGVIGTIEASRIATGRKNWLVIEVRGSRGYVKWNLNYLNYLEVFIEGKMDGPQKVFVVNEKYPYIERFWPPNGPLGLADGFTIAFAEYLKAVSERREYVPSFKDGAINCSVMDAMLRSWKGKKCVEVAYEGG